MFRRRSALARAALTLVLGLAGCSDPALEPVPVSELTSGACARAEARAARVPAWEEELLVERTHCHVQQLRERRSHVAEAEVLPGAFEEHALAPLRRLQAAGLPSISVVDESVQAALREFDDGRAPRSTLPDPWARLHREHVEDVFAFLRASCAQAASSPSASIFRIFEPDPEVSSLWVQRVVRLAAWRIREESDEGRTDVALEACADVIAIAGDHARQSLIGAMLGTWFLDQTVRSCAVAVEAATPEQRQRFITSIRAARSRWPTFAQILEVERLFLQLTAFGARLSEGTRVRLPAEAHAVLGRTWTSEGRDGWSAVRFALFGGYAQRRYLEQYGRMIDAAQLPPREAAPRYAALREVVELADLLVRQDEALGDFGTSWERFHARTLQGEAMLDGLIALSAAADVKARTGSWPTSWELLQQTAEVSAVRCPNTGRPLPLGEKESAAWLVIPAADGYEAARPVSMGRM